MSCSKEILVMEYIDGELSGSQQQEIKEHIAHCPNCAKLYKQLTALRDMCDKAKPDEEIVEHTFEESVMATSIILKSIQAEKSNAINDSNSTDNIVPLHFSSKNKIGSKRLGFSFKIASIAAAVVMVMSLLIYQSKDYPTDTIQATGKLKHELNLALQEGNTDKARGILQETVNVNEIDNDGYTPLYLACFYGYPEIVKLLLDANADVNTPIADGTTPIQIASYKGDPEIVKLLLDTKADINKIKPSEFFCSSVNIASSDIQNGLVPTNDCITTTNLALYTPLYIATNEGHTKIVKLLLQANANVNIAYQFNDPLCCDEVYTTSPLYIASKNGHTDIVKLLLDAKANVNTSSRFGYTPLYIASRQGYTEIVKLLLKAKADVNIDSMIGYTPLYIASQKDHRDIVKLLLDNGADVNTPDKNGFTPLYIASQKGHREIIALLLKANAIDNTSQIGVFSENFEAYTSPMKIHYYQNPTIWQVLGEHAQSVYIEEKHDNQYVVVNFRAKKHSWLSFGLVQKIDYYWNPPKNLTNAIISFDIASNLDNPIVNVLSAAVVMANGHIYRLPNSKLRNIPSKNDGWVSMSFDVNQFIFNNETGDYDPPFDPSQIVSMQILVLQTVNRFSEKGTVYLDNIIIKPLTDKD